ncbi:ethanolamine ammonia-lyase subunit EutC [Swaminathania salitolerans]|uniref:Ethanolamine ammonia-lyase small subunit n=1 Tax=Swaminathania salitolerans TaxID=182838 RepID=A0A511BN11_9PROT|nr:ethanolamine ammonia-lyase subunit EutC [Swaminathania salitolerans]GEL01726.1 ethanolamine ammonia-lyase light chain [Swaminathania salitolerans]
MTGLPPRASFDRETVAKAESGTREAVSSGPSSPDPWARLRNATRARIGLGRTGDTQITRDVLAFQGCHAGARDAVHAALDPARLAAAIRNASPLCPEPLVVSSQASDRATYLRRPDLGRRLCRSARAVLPRERWDLVLVLADGLSPRAVETQGPALFSAVCEALPGWRIAPPVIALQGRVAIGDEIAETMGAAFVAVLIGERPGLSVHDSMGVYLTYRPVSGTPDSRRNCLSNIHAHGLAIPEACAKLVWLLNEARRLQTTGVALKDRAPSLAPSSVSSAASSFPTSSSPSPSPETPHDD